MFYGWGGFGVLGKNSSHLQPFDCRWLKIKLSGLVAD